MPKIPFSDLLAAGEIKIALKNKHAILISFESRRDIEISVTTLKQWTETFKGTNRQVLENVLLIHLFLRDCNEHFSHTKRSQQERRNGRSARDGPGGPSGRRGDPPGLARP
jgi:hypothetical protein